MRELLRLLLIAAMCLALLGCESGLKRQVNHYAKIGDPEGGRRHLEQAVEREPENPEAHFLYGRLLLATGHFEEGRLALERSAELSLRYEEEIAFLLEKHLNEQFTFGAAAKQAERHEAAVEHFRNATHVAPASIAAQRALAQTLVEAGRLEEAHASYGAVAELDSTNREALINLTELALRLREYAEAAHYAAMHLDQLGAEGVHTLHEARDAQERLVYAQLGLDRVEEAERTLESLVGRYADSSVQNVVRAFAVEAFNAGLYEMAVPYLALAAPADTTGRFLTLLGEAHYALENYESMADVFSRLLVADSTNLDARRSLIRANEMLGYYEAARSHREELEKLLAGGSR